MGLENRGPQYSTLNSRILIATTPKYGSPNFRKFRNPRGFWDLEFLQQDLGFRDLGVLGGSLGFRGSRIYGLGFRGRIRKSSRVLRFGMVYSESQKVGTWV